MFVAQDFRPGATQQHFGAAIGINDFFTLFVRQKRRVPEAFEEFPVFVFRLAHGFLSPLAVSAFFDIA